KHDPQGASQGEKLSDQATTGVQRTKNNRRRGLSDDRGRSQRPDPHLPDGSNRADRRQQATAPVHVRSGRVSIGRPQEEGQRSRHQGFNCFI
ncbi:hypothetical protein PENTCL1PPCAC_8754, partial [Pristionchus entomophagus]